MRTVILVVVFLACVGLLSHACHADFSYKFSLPDHKDIVVTALGNGKIFLRLDGTLYQARNSSLEVPDAKGNLFVVNGDDRTLRIDLAEGIFFKINVHPKRPLSRWSKYSFTQKMDDKTILVEKGSVGDIDSPDTYIFNYRFWGRDRVFEIVQMSMGNEAPQEFKETLATFLVRRPCR